MKLRTFLQSLPFQLFLCLFLSALVGDMLPVSWIRTACTISHIFRELLLAFLPFVIFAYISSAILSLDRQAPGLIFAILGLVTLSNALSVCVSFGASLAFLPLVHVSDQPLCLMEGRELHPWFDFIIPRIASPDHIMILGIAFGLFFSMYRVSAVNRRTLQLQSLVSRILVRYFIPFLPFYVLGFALKMKYEGGLDIVFGNYGGIFGILCSLLVCWISLAYLAANGFSLPKTIKAIRHMIPAGITGFSTMSSAVTLPVTLASTRQNLPGSAYPDLVIPTTVNIHMMGDALSVPLLTFGIMKLFGLPLPDWHTFLVFVPAFCIAKFSLAAIPGGTIMVMLPILQSHFNLTPEVSSLITTLYILQDPVFTTGNVMGNGAFAILSSRILKPFLTKTAREKISAA